MKSDQRLWTADLCMLLDGHGVKAGVGDAISVKLETKLAGNYQSFVSVV